MSGHSKWAQIKRKKGVNDTRRGQLFTRLARDITIAVREGGSGDPESNFMLRLAVEKARGANMPRENIDRAIKRGTGELEGVTYEEVTYEGYAPNGVAVVVECLTDNRNRTGAEVRNIFSKLGGSMAEPGAVGWQFARKGVVIVASGDEDGVMMTALDAGADDVAAEGAGYRVTCDASTVYDVRDALYAAGYDVESAESTMVPSVSIEVTDSDEARKILRIMDALEDNEDVQDVYSNFDISDELMEAVGG